MNIPLTILLICIALAFCLPAIAASPKALFLGDKEAIETIKSSFLWLLALLAVVIWLQSIGLVK